MNDAKKTPNKDKYKSRIEISLDGHNTLYTEQKRRNLHRSKAEAWTIIEVASDILEQALAALKKEHEAAPV